MPGKRLRYADYGACVGTVSPFRARAGLYFTINRYWCFDRRCSHYLQIEADTLRTWLALQWCQLFILRDIFDFTGTEHFDIFEIISSDLYICSLYFCHFDIADSNVSSHWKDASYLHAFLHALRSAQRYSAILTGDSCRIYRFNGHDAL